MVASEKNVHSELALFGFLRERARAATETRLALDIAVGSVAYVVARTLHPAWWLLLASAGIALFSFGMWAFVDRVLQQRRTSRGITLTLEAARFILAGLGFLAALGAGFILWTMLMGTWIS